MMKSVTAPETRPDEQTTVKITPAILDQFYIPALEEACQSTFQNKVAYAIAKNHGYAQSCYKAFDRVRHKKLAAMAVLDKDGQVEFEVDEKGVKVVKFPSDEVRQEYIEWFKKTTSEELYDLKVQRVDMKHFSAMEGNIRAATLIHLAPMFLPDEEPETAEAEESADPVPSTQQPTPQEADVQP